MKQRTKYETIWQIKPQFVLDWLNKKGQSGKTLTDGFMAYLQIRGATGTTITESFNQVLTNLGYTGTFEDKKNTFYIFMTGKLHPKDAELAFYQSSLDIGGIIPQLQNDPTSANLTFAKDFISSQASLNADVASGTKTATFTAARSGSAPATYIDANGVIQLVTSANTPRYQGGYYDSTGFHAQTGLMIEAVGTNLVPKSYTMNDATWTSSNLTVVNGAIADPSNIAGGVNAASITATSGNANIQLTTAVTAATYSVWLMRKTGTGTINITANSGSTWTPVTLNNTWQRFQVSATSASQKCGIQIVTNGDAIYAYGNQFEANPYATSFIPTTTTSLTRPVEVLTYPIASNRTAAQESIFIKYAQNYNSANAIQSGTVPALTATDTKNRVLAPANFNNANKTTFLPNSNDSVSVLAQANTLTLNTSYVTAGIANTSSPYANLYLNGTSVNSYTTGGYTTNAWGTNFYIGCNNNSAGQVDGIIQAVAFYSTALNSTQVATITNILKTGAA